MLTAVEVPTKTASAAYTQFILGERLVTLTEVRRVRPGMRFAVPPDTMPLLAKVVVRHLAAEKKVLIPRSPGSTLVDRVKHDRDLLQTATNKWFEQHQFAKEVSAHDDAGTWCAFGYPDADYGDIVSSNGRTCADVWWILATYFRVRGEWPLADGVYIATCDKSDDGHVVHVGVWRGRILINKGKPDIGPMKKPA